ncbi:CASP-like protein 4C1 [Arachis ipaensis]|uniref:CASP-like protein 4C1 n=1 Tax=Arachis ipaensis TaxID=130454 RepID=UPI000A2B5247|nr:CASP-like protein 4C1 [Arachis ipaensis]
MRSPQQLRNGNRSPQEHHHPPRFHSTVAEHKLRRFNSLILLFRLVSFSFSLASSVFMLTNTHDSASPKWYHYDTFRFVLAANAIVAVYSLHDQVFAYLLLSASAAGTSTVRTLKDAGDACTASNSFCVQSDIAIALGYGAFVFLGFTSLLSGFRVVCFIINGSRFHL